MSNPAVTKLVHSRIDNMTFWMDDNIGESIHIHLGNFRLDSTIADVYDLASELTDSITKLVDVAGFDCRDYDPVYISRMLAPYLSGLKMVKRDTVKVGDLIVAYDIKHGLTKYVNVSKGRAIKALNGDPSENNDHRGSHHVGQTSEQRLQSMLDSVKEQGYPYNNQYIVVYGDQMLIRDGQHRASCLYHLYGNIEIPILRLYFTDEKTIKYETNYLKQYINNLKGKKISARRVISKIKRKMLAIKNKAQQKAYSYKNRDDIEYLERFF